MEHRRINSTCPNCGPVASKVTNSRQTQTEFGIALYRRRQCKECGARWTTFEVDPAELRKQLFPHLGAEVALSMEGAVHRVLHRMFPTRPGRTVSQREDEPTP